MPAIVPSAPLWIFHQQTQDVVTMLIQRCANVEATLCQRLVFAGSGHSTVDWVNAGPPLSVRLFINSKICKHVNTESVL